MMPILVLTLALGAPDQQKAVKADPHSGRRTAYSEERFALVIGVNTYKDREVQDLEFAVSDAQRIADQLIQTGNYPKENVILLHSGHPEFSHRPTVLNIWEAVAEFKSRAEGSEQVFVYFSGHGIHNPNATPGAPAGQYLLTQDTIVEALVRTSVPLDALVGELEQIDTAQRVVVVDACRNPLSGRKGGFDTNPAYDLSLVATPKGLGGSGGDSARTGEGTQIIQSSQEGAWSYEDTKNKQGRFTRHFLEGLDCAADGVQGSELDGKVTVEEVFHYVSTQLELAGEMKQQPVRAGEYWGDFVLSHCTSTGAVSSIPGASAPRQARPLLVPSILGGTGVVLSTSGYLWHGQTHDPGAQRTAHIMNWTGAGLAAIGGGAMLINLLRPDRALQLSWQPTSSLYPIPTDPWGATQSPSFDPNTGVISWTTPW